MTSRSRLAAELRGRLGPPPVMPDWPSVSIVVLNRNGADRLPTLIAGLKEQTRYPDFELILVDNGSSDESLHLTRATVAPFPISIVANSRNESFSDGCNQGAERARGELLLFLNNDVEPFEPGWLSELVACLTGTRAGIAGATLLEHDRPDGSDRGLRVQQRGTALREVAGALNPVYRDRGADPLGAGLGRDVEPVAVSGACCLIGGELFRAIGGFTHGYVYGGEDFDLALKARREGASVVCSGRSFVVHPAGVTLKALDADTRRAWTASNRRLFRERWGPYVRRQYELDRRAGAHVWSLPDELPGR